MKFLSLSIIYLFVTIGLSTAWSEENCQGGMAGPKCTYFPQLGRVICGNGCQYFPQIGAVKCSHLDGGACHYFPQVGSVICGTGCDYFPQIGQIQCVEREN